MTVSEQIIQVLNALCEKFGIVIDWTSANVIPYLGTLCGKLVSYEIWTSVAWMAFMVVLSIIGIIVAKVLYEKIRDAFEVDDFWQIPVVTCLTVVWLATIVVLGTQVMDIIKCVTFPEMYVFEYVTNLVKSAG